MITIEQRPISDPDRKLLHDWLNHPARLIYQRCLASQAAEKSAEAANILVKADNPELDEGDAEIKAELARVLMAAKKFLDEAAVRDYKFYEVELKPEPPLKN